MRRPGLLAALAAVLLLAGCSAIPTGGPVQAQTAQPQQAHTPGLVAQAYPPPAGAGPTAIVQGFVQAATAGAPYRVAKEFMTHAAAAAWKPGARVLVNDQPWTESQHGSDGVELAVPTVARVDGTGAYTPATGTVRLEFRLQRTGGEWRIASAPNGVVLPTAGFQRVFKPASLAFFDPGFRRLVPDLRWFPTAGGPTAVLSALLAGPSAPLAGGVTVSAFPVGTRLVRATASPGGPAEVVLQVPGSPAAAALQQMQQQVAASLGRSSPAAVRLVVDGRSAPAARALAPTTDARPLVLAGGRFGLLDDRGVTEDAVLGKRIVAARPTAVTSSARQRLAALRTAAGTQAVTATTTRTVDPRRGLLAPSLDQDGWIYSVPASDPTGLQAARATGAPVVPLPTRLGGGSVRSIEVSPDGTRMLVLTDDGSRSTAFVAGIDRDSTGEPIGLTSARYQVPLGPDAGATDATWVDDADVAVLTTSTDGQQVVVQQLGGLSSTLGDPPGPVSVLIGGGSQMDLRALEPDTGTLVRPAADNQWESALAKQTRVTLLAVQR